MSWIFGSGFGVPGYLTFKRGYQEIFLWAYQIRSKRRSETSLKRVLGFKSRLPLKTDQSSTSKPSKVFCCWIMRWEKETVFHQNWVRIIFVETRFWLNFNWFARLKLPKGSFLIRKFSIWSPTYRIIPIISATKALKALTGVLIHYIVSKIAIE